jgi:hypothetical protein
MFHRIATAAECRLPWAAAAYYSQPILATASIRCRLRSLKKWRNPANSQNFAGPRREHLPIFQQLASGMPLTLVGAIPTEDV